MEILKGSCLIFVNLILYTSFGLLIIKRKGKELSLGLSLVTGFFMYYFLFFLVCFPFMKKYRPLSWLSKTWLGFVVLILTVSLILCRKELSLAIKKIVNKAKEHPLAAGVIVLLVLLQILLVSITYNFTLDAAYYVSNVGTCVNTNMINVYDPFTGAWQDHYELRYFFATYSVNDAVLCQLTGIKALIWTKYVMSATVIIIVNVIYYKIAVFFYKENARAVTVMMSAMFFVNLTFISMYTSSLFLLTRTYEGKTVIGNIALPFIFYIYLHLISDGESDAQAAEEISLPWLILFIVSAGAVTISSSANMLVPGALCVMFVPYIIVKKSYKNLPKLALCLIPGIVMTALYVLYIEGYFVFYTYPKLF